MNHFSQLDEFGYEIVRQWFDNACIETLRSAFSTDAHGQRNIVRIDAIRALIQSDTMRNLVGANAFAVRGIFFDKLPDANWGVPWHRDETIAVKERIDTPGFIGWSTKDGVAHTRPPRHILDSMVTVRIHLDDCAAQNGPVSVVPGSHLTESLDTNGATECLAMAGDVLLMKPLTLHSSRKSENPAHRRVVHIEFAFAPLPEPLAWADMIPTS